MRKLEKKLWKDIMNTIKMFSIFIMFIFITGCYISPWRTIKFISYPAEKLEDFKIEDIRDDNDNLSNSIIDNVFFYFCSNGIEDTVYSTKSPYSINFVFQSFDKNTVITINSIIMKFDGKEEVVEDTAFPFAVTIDFPGYLTPELYSGNYETEYVYDLKKVQEISVTANVTIKKDGIEITKDLKVNAFKDVKMGLFQYIY